MSGVAGGVEDADPAVVVGSEDIADFSIESPIIPQPAGES
jgi:hypothetical protein